MKDQSQNHRPDLQEWEEAINALLDGELDDGEAEQLKAAATRDQALARAIIEAYQLQQALASIPQERAPASLQRKLAAIPSQQKALRRAENRVSWFQPRWMGALAAVPVLVVAAALISQKVMQPEVPTQAEIHQAQQELAVALTYLGKVGRMTNQEIGETVNDEMQEAVNDNMIQAIQDQMEFNKERSA